MKEHITERICQKLDELELPYTMTDGTRIEVSAEFYDVGYGMQPKKVLYELSAYLDEPRRAVSLSVRTMDFNLLPDGTLEAAPSVSIFRKVKRVSVGPDGQNMVTTVDLGAAPNAIKNLSFENGWKFRTTLTLSRRGKIADNADLKTASKTPVPVAISEPEPDAAEPSPVDDEPDAPITPVQKKSLFSRALRRIGRRKSTD